MDLMDMSTRGASEGFALVAVDVHSRYVYGELFKDKTLGSLLKAFDLLLQIRGAEVPNKTSHGHGVPDTIDTDRERVWVTAKWAAEMARRNIQHRFKTDRFYSEFFGND